MAYPNPNYNQQQQAARAPAATAKKDRPFIRIFLKDVAGKMIKESEISLWKNASKDGSKEYFSGKDAKGNKYVGFLVADKLQ